MEELSKFHKGMASKVHFGTPYFNSTNSDVTDLLKHLIFTVACVNVTYVSAKEAISVFLTWDGKTILSETISGL